LLCFHMNDNQQVEKERKGKEKEKETKLREERKITSLVLGGMIFFFLACKARYCLEQGRVKRDEMSEVKSERREEDGRKKNKMITEASIRLVKDI